MVLSQPPYVYYSSEEQLSHSSQGTFKSQLHLVWKNIHAISGSVWFAKG